MTPVVPDVPTRSHRRRGTAPALAIAIALGLCAGAATALAQGRLPAGWAPLANSSGAWTLLAFLLALPAPTALTGALCGCTGLVGMLAGYVATDLARGYPSSTGLLVFWGAAAVLVGPLLGLGAQWWRRGTRAALGLSAPCGVLLGEAGYGLTVLAASTDPRYWWGQAVLGVLLLGAGAVRKLRGVGACAQAVLFTAAVATAFPVLYLHGSVVLLLVP
ncbi:DUF6518 family protein [Saccharopolyspora sp. ID03-671]|uniref:DUF6518 family protein n=1 Tax=Saccharopolyspora sp. ID03-671 TaxID=3073066 RepID=UPI003251AFED